MYGSTEVYLGHTEEKNHSLLFRPGGLLFRPGELLFRPGGLLYFARLDYYFARADYYSAPRRITFSARPGLTSLLGWRVGM